MVKRYSGRTAEEALSQAKWELGDDAVILSSGKMRDRWWKFWQNGFQVLVATDYPVSKSSGSRGHAPPSSERVVPLVRRHSETVDPSDAEEMIPALDRIEIRETKPASKDRSAPSAEPITESDGQDEGSDHLVKVLQHIDDRLGRLEGFSRGAQQKAYAFLLERGMDLDLARELAGGLSPKAKTNQWQADLAEAMRQRMPESAVLDPQGKQMVVVVVGPTGSGKTTTIAKLAAHYHLERKQSVLMVTTDTFRVGAVEQLETFAGILKVPFKVANRAKEVRDLVEQGGADVVLIDTQGHSVRHSLHMAEVRSVWEGARTTDVLLTVPATLASDEARALITGFLQGEPGKLVITKVDEAHRSGPILSALVTANCPIAFVTDGQSVPEDLHVADGDRLVAWLMEGEYRG